MREAISEIETALKTLGKGSPWEADLKVSDEFLTPLFEAFFRKISTPNLMAKKNFYELASFVPEDEFEPEVRDKLDEVASVAESASPLTTG